MIGVPRIRRAFGAATGREGIKLFKENSPDCVLLDIALPDMDGLSVLKEIRGINSSIAVHMVTGIGGEAIRGTVGGPVIGRRLRHGLAEIGLGVSRRNDHADRGGCCGHRRSVALRGARPDGSLAYAGIAGKLVRLGLSSEPPQTLKAAADDAVSGARPDLLDRNGEILATDIQTMSVFAEPKRIIDALAGRCS